ncbi:hypothetical protein SELMODRAFT_417814 [Selaginella moellendorffii]|uniref:Protein kinase domain-containing protein n=1 Tax=Selaginella moellendorffii TaxID=88036 RepID=D8S3Q1_SELML|nr:probable LRR receptor-like serine/threonine-protein kinase At2g16250 [Selaginella moellendorffii]XP_024539044.1 probable LRR receptor-like serine/threonine-protein kinase At2g16250 [Selaginella moellendorffii]EFJ20797.1 hypothetical protein SELMODRAFT_417814 [Selaginella moellendorffii]|eukprot:XP_002978140.1 probable LRR receptor-like serine/threonine-protein kinase At2g16250 [Selaginella moellendorffii]
MDVRLAVWGVFGGLGFAFFLMLIELLRRYGGRDGAGSSSSAPILADSSSTAAAAAAAELSVANLLRQVLRDFSYQQLHQATNGFAQGNLLREGLFAGTLGGDGKEAVVIKSVESREMFDAEVAMLAGLGHSSSANRFVQIIGICSSSSAGGGGGGDCADGHAQRMLLVLRQMPNGDLASALRRGDEFKSSDGETSESSDSSSAGSAKPLDWITRFKIAIGVAEALAFLHHDCSPAVIHRDLKSSSVFLDEGYEVRLGSFGKACRQQYGNDVFPVYDIYCYGKVLLDLLSGLDISSCCDGFGEAWLHRALPLMEFGKRDAFLRLVDPTLVLDEDHVKELMLLAVIAKSCLDPEHAQHQTMSNVLHMLQNPAFFLALAGQG